MAVTELSRISGGRGVRHRHVSKSGKVVEHVHGLSCECGDEEDLEIHHKHDDNTLLLSMKKRKNSEDGVGIRHRHRMISGKIVEHMHALDCNCDEEEPIEIHHFHDESVLMDAKEVHVEKNVSMRRRIIQRIAIRILAITCFILAFKLIPLPFSEWFEDFVDYVEKLRNENLFECIAAYTAFSVLFCSFAPTGYLPTLVGGMVFQIYIAIPISWVGVNLGAIFNMTWIRHCRRHSSVSNGEEKRKGCIERIVSRAVGRFEGLDDMLREEPVSTVVIVRFPFMYNGLLNYVFSVSSVRVLPYAIGNAIGFIPGCVVFSILGAEVKSFGRILSEGGSAKEWLIFLGIMFSIIVAVLAFKWQSRRIQRTIEASKNFTVKGNAAAVAPMRSDRCHDSSSSCQCRSCNRNRSGSECK